MGARFATAEARLLTVLSLNLPLAHSLSLTHSISLPLSLSPSPSPSPSPSVCGRLYVQSLYFGGSFYNLCTISSRLFLRDASKTYTHYSFC